MRVGLVLGAGGVIGSAWLAGGLKCLEEVTGWNARDADVIVGTSAGSLIGALCAAGAPPWRTRPSSTSGSDPLAEAGRRPQDENRSDGDSFSFESGFPRLGPASPRLALNAMRQRDGRAPSALALGLLPEGVVSTAPVENIVRRVVPSGWADHRGLWVVACDYQTGGRTVFGRDGAPRADLADAVAASCAIPSFYSPKTIAGRRYVDGGVWSTSNLDLVADEQLDLVICLNPTSSLHPAPRATPVARLAAGMRTLSGRRLGNEAKEVVAAGSGLVLVQPTADDLRVMPSNLMSRRRKREVYETAQSSVAAQLREPETQALLASLSERPSATEAALPRL